MERILLVSATEKSRTMLSQFLTSCGVQAQLAPASSGTEARRMLVDGLFDLVLINTPLPAIADAVYNAIGTRFYELPITPEQIAMAVEENR